MLENYKKQKSKVEEKGNPKQPERTLREILADKRESTVLAGFLEKDGKSDVAKRLITASSTEADLDILDEYRKNNIERFNQISALEKIVTPEYVKGFAANSPEFQKLVNLVGVERAADVIKKQFAEIVVSDTERFEAAYNSVKTLDDFKSGKVKALDESIQKECAKHGVSEKALAEILAIEDAAERNKKLQEEVKKSYGFFKSAGDFFSRGKFSKASAEKLAVNKAEMDATLGELDGHLQGVGLALSKMVSENDDVRKAIMKEAIGDKQEKAKPETSFQEIKQERDQVDTKWKEEKEQILKDQKKSFESLNETEKDDARNKFRERVKQEHAAKPKKKNLWDRFWDSIFDRTVDDKELE